VISFVLCCYGDHCVSLLFIGNLCSIFMVPILLVIIIFYEVVYGFLPYACFYKN